MISYCDHDSFGSQGSEITRVVMVSEVENFVGNDVCIHGENKKNHKDNITYEKGITDVEKIDSRPVELEKRNKRTFTEHTETSDENNDSNPVDFETAIAYTGYGRYNRIMLVSYIPLTMTTLFCTSSASFILPAARCYFDLTALQEGCLYGAVYVGMVSSAFLWGFLIDTLGRQQLLFYGLLFGAITEFSSGLVQRYWVLVVLKFFSGVMSCGPYSLAFTFLSEFYDKKYRDKIVLCSGGCGAFAYVFQPIIAYFLIPMDVSYEFFNGNLVIDNWRIFLMTGSLLIFLASFLVYFMDESPKFLMAVGRHEEALNVFRKMYSQNTGNPPESYPVKALKSENVVELRPLKSIPSISVKEFFKNGWSQIKPFFMEPFLTPSVLTFSLLLLTMGSMNTFRLRLPQMFAKILAAQGDDDTISVCESKTAAAVGPTNDTNVTFSSCRGTTALVDPEVYVNSMVIGAVTFSMFWIAIYITKYFDKNNIYKFFVTISGFGIVIFPWTHGIVTLSISAIYIAVMNICISLVISIMASAVPTVLRGMAVNMVVMFGRIGVILGNLFIPKLTEINCELSFFVLSFFHFMCLGVITILIRIKKKRPNSEYV